MVMLSAKHLRAVVKRLTHLSNSDEAERHPSSPILSSPQEVVLVCISNQKQVKK